MKRDYQEHDGHRLEILVRGDKPQLLIDDIPVAYGRLPNGKFFFDDYAFDWSDDLMEVARRYVSYRGRVQKIRAQQIAQKAK